MSRPDTPDPLRSSLIFGRLHHARLGPERHAFTYDVVFCAIDLAELDTLGRRSWLFGVNRRRALGLRERDYLDRGAEPLRERLFAHLRDRGVDVSRIARVQLITTPRWFTRVFNPVSFYLCRDENGGMVCAVAEVNNTFKERHLYTLERPEPPRDSRDRSIRYSHPKQFHVSPFNNREGDYAFSFFDDDATTDITVDLIREGETILHTRWSGTKRPMTSARLAQAIARFPLGPLLAMPRIVWEAIQLRYRKKLDVWRKPAPDSPDTIGVAPPTWAQRMAMKLVVSIMQRRVLHGRLIMELPDGSEIALGDDHAADVAARLVVRNWRFFTRLARHGDIGFAESYMAGEWTSPDLARTLITLCRNLSVVSADTRWTRFTRLVERMGHTFNRNTRRGSRRNIQAHYDLSNDFFRLFLDGTMTYSSAMFGEESEPLERAQQNKLDAILRKSGIGPGEHLLEIGSGWGSLAIRAAQTIGCRVTTLTLSNEQLALARERVATAGLERLIDVRLCDYRDITGQYDAVVSIEMLEAVGHENFPAYFRKIDEALKPGGRAAIQVITIQPERYERYRRRPDFIQKHIFPGGFLPTFPALEDAMREHTRLGVDSLTDIGPHYATTLRRWRERFMARADEARAMGFDDDFLRKWEYYFAYCEAGFATGAIFCHQMEILRDSEVKGEAGDESSSATSAG